MEKNRIMMIIIIVLIVILLVAIGGVGFLILRTLNVQTTEAPTVETQVVAQLTPEEITEVPLSKPIATNLRKGADGAEHMISVSFSIGVDNTDKKGSPKIVELLTQKENIIRDICLGVVRDKTFEELSRPDGQDILRKEVLLKIQETFKDNLIVMVYVFDIALQ